MSMRRSLPNLSLVVVRASSPDAFDALKPRQSPVRASLEHPSGACPLRFVSEDRQIVVDYDPVPNLPLRT